MGQVIKNQINNLKLPDMEKKSRRKFSAEFKVKVALEAIRERHTVEELARKHELHPTQINSWKKEFLNKAAAVFEAENPEKDAQKEADTEKLYAQIGQLKMENDWLKKNYSSQDFGRSQIHDRQATSSF